MPGDERCFANPFPQYTAEGAAPLGDLTTGVLSAELLGRLESCARSLADRIEEAVARGRHEGTAASDDASCYTGVAGYRVYANVYNGFFSPQDRRTHSPRAPQCISWSLWRYAQAVNDQRRRDLALELSAGALKYAKGKRATEATLLCGDSGPLVVAAAIHNELAGERQHAERRDAALGTLRRLANTVASQRPDALPDELLYGRMGVVAALHFARRHAGAGNADQTLIDSLVATVMSNGAELVRQVPDFAPHTPLMWQWHGSYYLGAAHGLAGILYGVMKTSGFDASSERGATVRRTLDYCASMAFASGNMPSSVGRECDTLVHWCHGAPGWLHTFLLAHTKYGADGYLQLAVRCGDVLWSRGLLRKGYSLCHGTAGNAYGFVALWQHTKQPVHLYRPIKFAEWIMEYGKHGCRTPDRPFSMFEGMAGALYYIVDLMQPAHAQFPMFC